MQMTGQVECKWVGKSVQLPSLTIAACCALYDNLGHDASLALAVDAAVLDSRQDDWRSNSMKIKRVRLAIKNVLDQWGKDSAESQGSYSAGQDSEQLEALLELVKHQHEY